jgi:K+-transporting ATPase ATPase C chain
MQTQLRPALVLLVAMTAVTGLAYPLAVTGLAMSLMATNGTTTPPSP